VCARLEGDSPMVEGFRWPLELAAGCGFWRGTTLVTTARFAGASLAPLLGCGVVFCCVRCLRALFVWWWCSLRRVMYECFFLYDVAVLLPFISKK